MVYHKKTSTIKSLFSILACIGCLSFTAISCSDSDKENIDGEKPEITGKIAGSTWKCIKVIYPETNETIEFKQPADNCFLLNFGFSRQFTGRTSVNDVVGYYTQSMDNNRMQISIEGGTKVLELGLGALFAESLGEVDSYSFSENYSELYLFCKNNTKHLILEKPEITGKIAGSTWKCIKVIYPETNETIEFKQPADNCFLLNFGFSGQFTGITSVNDVVGYYTQSMDNNRMQISVEGGTEVLESELGTLFAESLGEVESYSFSENNSELFLYCKNNTKHLICKKL